MLDLPLRISPPVAEALDAGRPVVALESTIITHGLPRPHNLKVANDVQAIVTAAGAVPATIAVMHGELRIGLGPADLETLAGASDVRKLSRADLGIALAQGATGSTTVSATMIGARVAGIKVFATGGIGGVHRGADTTFDISADLQELAQTPVTVVAAGAKAILDLPKTLEVLETLGVPVIGYRTDRFPALWFRDSGLPVPQRMDTTADIAKAHLMRAALGLPGGQLVTNPIPEAAALPAGEIESAITAALQAASAGGITAKAVTPFVLDRVLAHTEGRSLIANIALVKNNAQLAAEIAIEMARADQAG